MFHKEANLIGFKEAQKTICSLKEEVQIAEKKLRNVKRSFIEQSTKIKSYEDNLSSGKQLTQSEFPKSKESKNKPGKQFTQSELPKSKEPKNKNFPKKAVPYKISSYNDEKTTVPKKIYSTSEEEPHICPSKFPPIQLTELKTTLISSSDNLLSTTEDSVSVYDIKHSSSERTSSLIANPYKETDESHLNKYEAKEKVVTTDLSKSSASEISQKEHDFTRKKVLSTEKLLHTSNVNMEWIDMSKNKAFSLQNKFKTESIHKLKDIINRQKKKQELYQSNLEQEIFGNVQSVTHEDICSNHIQQFESRIKDDQVLPTPIRKVRTVKSLPIYKGFSAPPGNLPISKRWRKQRNKYTIANLSNLKSINGNITKRIKAKVKSEFMSASHGQNASKSTKITNKDESCSKHYDSNYSETFKESTQNKESDNKQINHVKPIEENISLKNDIQLILKNNQQQSSEDSLKDVKDTIFSYDAPKDEELFTRNKNQNIFKKVKKSPKSKIKSEPVKEQNVSSPKIKQYDVEKIREYIRKKKEERKKRHLEEHKIKIFEAQKKKECLEKLIEYQKQNIKAVAKIKPLSPTKVCKNDNLTTEKHESTIHRMDHAVQNSTLLDIHQIQEKDKIISRDSGLKRKSLEGAQKKNYSVKKHISINNLQKKKQDIRHINISLPKFISASATPTLVHQIVAENEDNLISSDGAYVEAAAKFESLAKPLTESLAQETIIKPIESVDSDNFHVFKNISSVSTPSCISQITGIDSEILEELKVCEAFFSEKKEKKNEELKKLIETINIMTEPIEPLLYTKQWLNKNPFPPKSKVQEITNLTKQQQFHESTDDHNIQMDMSEAKSFKESSFKEQISGIGDIDQLYNQILGKKSTKETVFDFERQSVVNKDREGHHKNHLGNSEAHNHSDLLDHSNYFSDLQKENIIPDPFNFINTWKKKPLGFILQNKKKKFKDADVSSEADRNVPLEEVYKSILSTSKDDKLSESFTSEAVEDSGSYTEKEISSFIPEEQNDFTSRTDILTEISSNTSDTAVGSTKNTPSKLSISPSNRLSKKSLSKSNGSSKSESQKSEINKNDVETNKISQISFHKQTAFLKNEDISEKPVENVPNVSTNNVSDMIISGTINSEYTLETEKDSSATVSGNASDVILSGTISSDYTLDMDDGKSDKEELEESIKEQSKEKTYASESSISEVISVVENSKGFRSSMEDLLSNKKMPSEDLEHSDHKSINVESVSTDKESSKHISEVNMKHQIDYSSISDKQSIFVHTSKSLKNEIEQSTLSHKSNHLHNISTGSQNSVAIDFRQPLRFTLSSEETSIQANEGINIHGSQYLHTQVVTRVASEAAAAAATSAIIAVFETQKVLLSEKTHFETMNSYGKSSNSKKTYYSSDFESSADASSPNAHSCAVGNKHSESVAEDSHVSNNKEILPRSESIEEEISLNHSNSDQMTHSNSTHSSLNRREKNQPPVYQASIENTGPLISERSKRKISSNISSPSPASLSENGSLTTETSISSRSNLSHLNESALSDDSFAQLTLDVVHRMMQDEELHALHQLDFLKFQEKSLVQKARAEMTLLEAFKKKCRQKGAGKKVSIIRKRQKELILRLRQERTQLQCMQEAYRSMYEKHNAVLKDKKKLFKEPSLLVFEPLNKDEKSSLSKYPDSKQNECFMQTSSSTSSLISDNNEKNVINEDSTSEVPEMLKDLASNSSQDSVIETQPSEFIKTSGSPQNKSQRNSPNPQFIPFNATLSNSNPSMHSSNSLESVLQGLKKLEASKRHLTKREQRILQRRKKVEHLLQWQKKLDNEEMAVRELEKKVLDSVDHSRKKTKYYISFSGSTNQDDDKKNDLNHESFPLSSETPCQHSKKPEQSSIQYVHQNENSTHKTTSDESVHTNFSVNELEASTYEDEGNASPGVATHSFSLQEEINPEKEESSTQMEITEDSSPAVEVISEEMSNQVSPSIKDKSSNSDVYSESFETTESKKSPSVLSISPPFKYSSPSKNIKKDYGPGIRLPLVPRNLRRHDSSGSDDSYTISQSETASDQSDIEVRIHALSEELKRRKAEAEKLKKEQKKKKREHLKEKELSLQKQLEAYNQYIHQTKLELDQQIESSISLCQTSDVFVKPRIKWPRPEKVVNSRPVRKQTSLSSDVFGLEKKTEIINSGEIPENLETASYRVKDQGQKRLSSGCFLKTDEADLKKEIPEKSIDDSKEISEASSVDNASKSQEASEIMTISSVSSEISSEKLISEINENASLSSTKRQDCSEIKPPDSDPKHSIVISSQYKNKSSMSKSHSKSLTDTFTSETISSKISDLNSLQVDENIISNATISSDDELSAKTKKTSKDITKKSNLSQASNISHEVSSSEDSVSEIPSVNTSISFEEDVDCENSSKNLKCNSSKGCETFPIKEVNDGKIASGKLCVDILSKGDGNVALDEVSSTVSHIKTEKKKIASETKIVSIVNYVSTLLINDALYNVFEIYNKNGILKNLLNHESQGNDLQVESQKFKEKVAETVSHSLLDLHLEDAFSSLFKILKKRDIKSQKSILLCNNISNAESNMQAIHHFSSPCALDSNTTIIIEGTSEFSLNQLSCDINSNKIFLEPVNLNVNFISIPETEQQLQQQQLMLQQYPYFYRKIPNKPPPPYTPPSSSTLSSDFPFVKQKQVEKITTVKNVTKHIHEVIDHVLEVIIDGKSKGLFLSDISLSREDMNFSNLELSAPPQLVFVEFIFDLIKEIILEKFSETEQLPQPWLRPQKLTPKPIIPSSKEKILNSIQKDIEKVLKINEESKNIYKRKQILWSSLKLGRKKRDFVDTILIHELKEEEPDWVNYDQDEMTVKLQIADSIFNVLINDTVCTIKNLQQKLQV